MLAIVIPYYKLTFFETTLQSLACQTDQRFNVYIGDDASPENPISLLDKYKEKFDFLYYRFQENLGATSLTKQWERCIELLNNEEWIMILGDDDVLESNVIEEFYKQFHFFKNVNTVVRYSTIIIDSLGVHFSEAYIHPKLEKSSCSLLRKIRGTNRSSLSEYFFRKSSYSKCKFANYPFAWYSDDKAWLDFSESRDIYSINEAKVLIRFSHLSISGRIDNIERKLEATKSFFEYLFKDKKEEFSTSELLILFLAIEVEIKKHRKLKQSEWFFLFKVYLKNFCSIAFFKFFRRYLISTF